MLEGVRIAVVVPAHNEERLILRTLRGIPPYVDRIYVVDDGSRDATKAVATSCKDPRVTVLSHARNWGVGAAIVTGYKHAFADGAEAVAVMGGDAQMHPGDLPKLLAPILKGTADYTKGDRLSHPRAKQWMPTTRRIGNILLSWLTRLATGLPVQDSQCGYTVMSRRAAERLNLDSLWSRYGYPNDLLGQLQLVGARIEDVVVRPVYGLERSGVRLHHALFVVPYVLLRVGWRRARSPQRDAAKRPALAEDTMQPHGRSVRELRVPYEAERERARSL